MAGIGNAQVSETFLVLFVKSCSSISGVLLRKYSATLTSRRLFHFFNCFIFLGQLVLGRIPRKLTLYRTFYVSDNPLVMGIVPGFESLNAPMLLLKAQFISPIYHCRRLLDHLEIVQMLAMGLLQFPRPD